MCVRVAWTGRLVCVCSVRQTIGWRSVDRQTDVCVCADKQACMWQIKRTLWERRVRVRLGLEIYYVVSMYKNYDNIYKVLHCPERNL